MFETLTPFGLSPGDITSVESGPHVRGSAHFEGRALDVGSIGGVPVGVNAPTIQFLLNAIVNGSLEKIGTLAVIATSPALRAFAAQHGVELFVDDQSTGATGPHIHLQRRAGG
jgi:hypothetical protein